MAEPTDAVSTTGAESASARQPDRPRYLPLAINLAGMHCVVVGGGSVGARKATTLADAGAQVTVVAPEICAAVQELVEAGRVEWSPTKYETAMLEGCVLAVAATDDDALNRRIGAEAEARQRLCCVASAASASRVIFPAVYTAVHTGEEITVAVHSHGPACRRSQQVRNEIAAWPDQNIIAK
jgi:uroporphyrin-III C-methyltransferase / precorrin-2 dehydrogenase / sirohydrochlorin ferrochelatase